MACHSNPRKRGRHGHRRRGRLRFGPGRNPADRLGGVFLGLVGGGLPADVAVGGAGGGAVVSRCASSTATLSILAGTVSVSPTSTRPRSRAAAPMRPSSRRARPRACAPCSWKGRSSSTRSPAATRTATAASSDRHARRPLARRRAGGRGARADLDRPARAWCADAGLPRRPLRLQRLPR